MRPRRALRAPTYAPTHTPSAHRPAAGRLTPYIPFAHTEFLPTGKRRTMDIALLLTLVLINGLFAMSEIALVTARKPRLQKLVDDGHHSAQLAIELGEHPTRFLSTLQIGITAIGVL